MDFAADVCFREEFVSVGVGPSFLSFPFESESSISFHLVDFTIACAMRRTASRIRQSKAPVRTWQVQRKAPSVK